MNSNEHTSPNDFETSLRGLQPSPVAIDVKEMFYRAGLEAGTRHRPTFGKVEFVRLLSVALLTGIAASSVAYRAGMTSVAMPASAEFAITSPAGETIETTSDSLRSVADIVVEVDSDRPIQTTPENVRAHGDRHPLYAAFPDRLSVSFASNLPASAELYRLPRRSVSQVQNRAMLTARNADAIEYLLRELQ